ncbi:hypothetical protein KDH_69390 [Dictyobacter sp. S3.2.2.5]|uniref:Uncharacterized protein n=1 Tax=Dictyobacter halimunensis TaxID=3026934 RepID=A0ABQ6G2L4_9CHLR|nr:hypothetical protein KDH_69390 [Dictyobacter sp. S3.2.2.5]
MCISLSQGKPLRKTMLTRAEIAARGAYEGINSAIAPDALAHTLASFRQVTADEPV